MLELNRRSQKQGIRMNGHKFNNKYLLNIPLVFFYARILLGVDESSLGELK